MKDEEPTIDDAFVEQIMNQRRETKTFTRNERKLIFVSDNELEFREIIIDGLYHSSALSRCIIREARKKIEYSKNTCDVDIFRGLKNIAEKFIIP